MAGGGCLGVWWEVPRGLAVPEVLRALQVQPAQPRPAYRPRLRPLDEGEGWALPLAAPTQVPYLFLFPGVPQT